MYKAGQEFPSQEDKQRLQQYEDWKNLFDNEQWKLFVEKASELRRQRKIKDHIYEGIEQIYISIPIAMELPKLVSDLLFRYCPIIDCKDDNVKGQELAIDIQKYNKLHIKLLESSVDCATKGGIVIKTYLENGRSMIDFFQPDKYFIHKDLRGKIDEHIISWTFTVDKGVLKGYKEYRYIETHKFNKDTKSWWIYYQVFEIKGNKLNKQLNIKEFFPDLEDAEDTKLSTCSLIFIPYFRAMDNYFGYSVYHGLEGLFDELNSRVSHMSKLLDKYSDPTVTGPEIEEDEDEENIVRRGTTVREKYIVRDNKETPDVNYVTWDGKIEGHITYVKELLFTMLYICTPLNPSLYGLDVTNSQASGKAIKLKSFRTDCTVDRWSNYYIDGIQQAIFNAMEYQRIWVDSSVKSEYPDVIIVKGFSKDDKEEAEIEQLRITSGNTSILSSIMRLDRVTKEKAEEEYKAILEDKKKENESTLNPRKSLNLFGDKGVNNE